jgi:lipopolysaccharide export system permease protein
MILNRYVFSRFCTSAFFALLALLILFSIISLVETLEDVGQGSFTSLHAFLVILFETPNRIIELLPIVTLLGTIMGLGSLANNQEIAASRSAGMSILEFVKVFTCIAILVSLLGIIIQTYLIPGSEKQVIRLKSFAIAQTNITAKGFWSKRGPTIIRIEEMTSTDTAASIEIYNLAEQGNLESFTTATSAGIKDQSKWLLKDVTTRIVSAPLGLSMQKRIVLAWDSFLEDSELKTLTSPLYAISALDLVRYIRANQGSGVDTRSHEIILWQRLSFPITLLAMALIGVSLVFSSVKARSAGSRLLVAMGIGVLLYLLQQTTGHLSTLLNVSPVITVCVPPLAILSGALLAIKKI